MTGNIKRIFVTVFAAICCVFVSLTLFSCGVYGVDFDKGSSTEKYTVTFDAGEGTIYGDKLYKVEVTEGAKLSKPTENPVYDEHVFVCWSYIAKDASFEYDFATEKVSSRFTLHAVWARICNVTFDGNGGEFDGGKSTLSVKVAQGEKLTEPELDSPANHALVGWNNESGEKWDFGSGVVRNDITLTAAWDFNAAILAELAPYEYTVDGDEVTITGVKDKETLTVANIPSIVSAIGDSAFISCNALEQVVLHDGIKTVGEAAFKWCCKLESVTLPSGLKRIEANTFWDCERLAEINIPAAVEAIGEGAFYYCQALQTITLPSGVTEIADNMFEGCVALQAVAGGTVARIGESAFKGCAALRFAIPTSVTEIGDGAFNGCTSLEEVVLTSACESLGSVAFGYCTALKSVSIDCTEISEFAFFRCTALNELVLGSSVRSINKSFQSCTALEDVVIPDGVTFLYRAFSDCTRLKRVVVGSGVTSITADAFSGCVELKRVTLKEGVARIEGEAFKGCVSLIDFTVPSSVTYCASDAFSGCKRLKEIVNLSVATISVSGCGVISDPENSAFVTISDYVFYPKRSDYYTLVDYVGGDEDLILPADCNGMPYEICDYAFAYNRYIKSVALPACAEYVGDYMINGSDKVSALTVAAGNQRLTAQGNCIINRQTKAVIVGCKGSIIPTDENVVTAIASKAFYGCSAIESLVIPDNITEIGSDAFVGCDKILEAENGIKYIGKWAICVDYSDTLSIRLLRPRSGTVGIANDFVGYLNDEFFRKYITDVKFNAELKYIGSYAFADCNYLSEVKFNNGLLSIGKYAFYECNKIFRVILPDSVNSIGAWAFYRCTTMKTVVISEGLTEVSEGLFAGCSKLSEVVIPLTLTKVSQNAFSECSAQLTVFFAGATYLAWETIEIDSRGNSVLTNIQPGSEYIKYYSERRTRNGWHFDAGGYPIAW